MTNEEVLAGLKEAVERVENTFYIDAQEHARVVAERDAAKRDLASMKARFAAAKDRFAAAIAEYVELADRGIVRDSIIRDLFRDLKEGGPQ